jgi:hypothetical protein
VNVKRRRALRVLLSAAAVLASGCGPEPPTPEEIEAAALARFERALAETIRRSDAAASQIARALDDLPVVTDADEERLRRYLNGAHVARARALGVRARDEEHLDSLFAAGRLVQLQDSTEHWIVRPGTSPAQVVPAVPALLTALGTRFQSRIAQAGVPPYRIEVTSALRTSERQERLRASNTNAAAGTSSHEFGTTVDVSYAAFAPPVVLPPELFAGVPEHLLPHAHRIAQLAFESAAARKSRELGGVFSRVLREAQDEGLVLVIYERTQTIYHLTVARDPRATSIR